MQNERIVILATDGDSTNIVFNKISATFAIEKVFIEEKETKKVFLKRRIKKLGWVNVFGQILFQIFIVKWLSLSSKKRIQEIMQVEDLDDSKIPSSFIRLVQSINEERVIQEIFALNPSVIVVNGTRILSKKFLNTITCPIINTHTGITPKYRGVHGGYWALVNKDLPNCGVTIHLIDKGIDTGNILYQARIKPTNSDNFCTYPILQLGSGVNFLIKAISDALSNKLHSIPTEGESALWYHPTIWKYMYHRFRYGVK